MLQIKYCIESLNADEAIKTTRDLIAKDYYDFWVYDMGADKINGRRTKKLPAEVFRELTCECPYTVLPALANGDFDVNCTFWVISPEGDLLSTNNIYDLLIDFITEAIEELYISKDEIEERLGL